MEILNAIYSGECDAVISVLVMLTSAAMLVLMWDGGDI